MPKKPLRGRALCRKATEDLGSTTTPETERFAALTELVCCEVNRGDSDFGQLHSYIVLVGEGTELYCRGASAYVHVMAATGNHPRALRAACLAAGLKPPAEDIGPFDHKVDRTQVRLNARTIRRGTPSRRLRKFLTPWR